MSTIKKIIKDNSHRPFKIPFGRWVYYQEWNNALFFHWEIPFDILRKHVPLNLQIDTFDGKCYVSLVAFTMENLRPRLLPSISYVSDFDEINIRTYVCNDGKKGVYFLNIEAAKSLSVYLAKLISDLPYEKAQMQRTAKTYSSENQKKGFKLFAEFEIKEEIDNKTELDKWLTERYCLYLEKNNSLYRYDIHHREWVLKTVDVKKINVKYKIGEMDLSKNEPNYIHYSDGIKVLAWKRERL